MECFGRGSSAVLSVSFEDWRFRRRKETSVLRKQLVLRRRWRRPLGLHLRPLCAVVGEGAKEGCVATRKTDGVMASQDERESADEEDLNKAGGRELFYVRMQERKPMEDQSKIGDKLPLISPEDSTLDLIVIGCGPAGLSLAAESAKKGLNVGLIGPDLPFTNNYGVWEDEFKDLGLESCIDHAWRDTILHLDSDDPIFIGRAYGRVNRHLLHEELLRRCHTFGVKYLDSKVERIVEGSGGCSVVACEKDLMISCRLAIVASGAASGKLLEYEVGGPRVSVQTAYGVEVENNPYDPSLMVFMDYRDYVKGKQECPEAEYPTFLYVMPMSPTRVFFEETCLTSKEAMPFNLLKNKNGRISQLVDHYQIRSRRTLHLVLQLVWYTQLRNALATRKETAEDIEGIRTFFQTFFLLPNWMWQGFLGSTLSSADLVWFAFYMFAVAPNSMRMYLVRHLLSDPTGATMLKTYLTL